MAYQVGNSNLLAWLLENHPDVSDALTEADRERLERRVAPSDQYDRDTWLEWAENQVLHARQVRMDALKVSQFEEDVRRQETREWVEAEGDKPMGPYERRLWEEHGQTLRDPFDQPPLEITPGHPEWPAYLEKTQGVIRRQAQAARREAESKARPYSPPEPPNAPPFQPSPVVHGRAAPETVQAARERLGAPTPQDLPTPSDEWKGVYEFGAQLALTRAEVRAQLAPLYGKGEITSPEDARRFLSRKYLGGYTEARRAYLDPLKGQARSEAEAGFPKPHRWQRFPEHLRLRMQHSRPVSTFDKDDYNQPKIGPEWVRRGQESHVFSEKVLRRGSFLGQTPHGETVLTYDPSKMEKRIQMLGAHETVRMTGLKDAPAFLKEGAMMSRAEQAQVARMALVIGGDVGGPGTMLVDPSVGMGVQREYREVRPKEGYALGELAKTGDVFMPGTEMQLASGLTGEKTDKWRYTVQDVVGLEGGGHGFVLERAATSEQLRGRSKFAGTKAEWSVRDLSGVTDAGGQALDLQMVGSLKDLQGAAYQWYKARGTDYLHETIKQYRETLPAVERAKRNILGRNVTLPETYQELGSEALEAWKKVVVPQAVQTIQVPQTLTKENLAAFRKSGALVEESVRSVEPGAFRADVRYQALVGEFATQTSHDYPVRRPFLSAEELDNLRRSGPQGAAEYNRIMAYSAAEREARRDVFNAALTSLGTHKPEPGTTPLSKMTGVPSLLASAQEAVRARLGLSAADKLPHSAIVGEFMQALAESRYSETPMSIPSQHGDLVLPAPKTMVKFGAGGQYQDDEMSSYLRSAFDAIAAQAGGASPETVEKAVVGARSAQEALAGGKEFQRTLEGAFLKRATGDVLHSSLALRPGEVYIPGLDPGPVNTLRWPTAGPESHELVAMNVSQERAKKLGINTQEFTASLEIVQAMRGDTDGDLAIAMERGLIEMGPGGKMVDTTTGQVLQNEQQILGAARKAVRFGAADLRGEEMAGMGRGFVASPQDALKTLNEVEVTKAQPDDLRAQIAQGSRMRGLIGQYYNVFRGGAAQVPEYARRAYQTLFNISHERAQRPAPQVPALARFHQLAKMNLLYRDQGTGKLLVSGGAYFPEKGKFGYFEAGYAGGEALKQETLSALLNVRDDKDNLLIGARGFSQLMRSGRGQAAFLEKAFRAYHKAETPEAQRRIRMAISERLGPWQEWAVGSAVGPTLAAPAVKRAWERAQEHGYDFERFARTTGLTPEQAQGFLEMREAQQLRIGAHERKPTKGLSGFLDKVRALRSVGLGRWIAGDRDLSPERIAEIEAGRQAEQELLSRKKAGIEAPPDLFEDAPLTDEMIPPEFSAAEKFEPQPVAKTPPSDLKTLARRMYTRSLGMDKATRDSFYSAATEGWSTQGKAALMSELKALGFSISTEKAQPEQGTEKPGAPPPAPPSSNPPPTPPSGGPPPSGPPPTAPPPLPVPGGEDDDRYQRLVASIFGVGSHDFAVTQKLLRENVGFWEKQVRPDIEAGRTLSKEGIASTKQIATWARTIQRGLRQRGEMDDLVGAGLLTEGQESLLGRAGFLALQSDFERKAGFATDPQSRAGQRVRRLLSEKIAAGEGLTFRELAKAGVIGGLSGAEMGALAAHVSDIKSPTSRVSQVASMIGAGYSKGAVMGTVEEMYGKYPVEGQSPAKAAQDHVESLETLTKRLGEWEKAVMPAIKAGKDLTSGQIRATRQIESMLSAVPETPDVARGRAMVGQAQEHIGEQQWRQMLGGRPDESMGLRTRLSRAGRKLMSGWELMRLQRMWGLTGGYAMGAIPLAAQEEQVALQAATVGLPMGQTQPGGIMMDLMTTRARQQQFQLQMGRSAQRAWGWMPGLMADTGLGTVAGIGLPAAGLGLAAGWGASLLGLSAAGPIGLGVGLAAAGFGGYNYVQDVASDREARSLAASRYIYQGGGFSLDLLGSAAGRKALMAQFDAATNPLNYLLGNGGDASVQDIMALMTDQERQELGYGLRLQSGELSGLSTEGRIAAIQEAYQYAPQWMEQTSAEQLATQWLRFTPGATNIRDVYQDPRFSAMAARGTGPEQFVKMAQEWGQGPERWLEFADLSLGVSEQQFGPAMFTAQQWQPLQQMGMDPLDILKRATSPFQTEDARDATAALTREMGKLVQVVPGVADAFELVAGKIEDTPLALERLERLDRQRLAQVAGAYEGARLAGFQTEAVPEAPTAEWVREQYQQLPTLQAQMSLRQRLVGMGAEGTAATSAAETLGSVGEVNAFNRFLGGDRFTWSVLGQRNVQGFLEPNVDVGSGYQINADQMKTGFMRALQELLSPQDYKRVADQVREIKPLTETDTGLKMGTTRMWGGFAEDYVLPGGVNQAAFDQATRLAEASGQRGLRLQQQGLQYGYQDFQQWQAGQRLDLQEVSQFGGRFVSPYGGGVLETQGSFAIQRELRNLSRIWEDFASDYNERNREVQYRQFMENWQVKAARLPVQFQWQREDLAFQGQKQAIQFGWQMEDIRENLRFATGRDRRRLLRQQERAAIMFGMGQGQLETQGERLDVREGWAKEDLERERRHFEERFALQDDYQSRYRLYVEERRRLEDELQRINEFNARFNIDAAREQLERQRELQTQLRAIQEAYNAINHALENAGAQQQSLVQMIQWLIGQFGQYGPVQNAWDGMISHMTASLNQVSSAASLSINSGGRGNRR